MSRRVTFTIPQIAAHAIGLDLNASTLGLGGVSTWRRNGMCRITCSPRDADRLIDLLRRRATASTSSPELLIECTCAIQAIYEVYDPRLAAHDN
jgi:hypothetical protein